MNILFIFPHIHHYDSHTVREGPSGGTEKTVVFLGEAFQQLGHHVEWITTQDALTEQDISTPDVVITQEASFLERFPQSQKVWWCHHFADQPIIQRNAAYGRAFADHVITLSQCQQVDFTDKLRIDSTVIGHGVWLEEVVKAEKDPYRLIYASTPFRGLERVPELFESIQSAEPRSTLAVCSSMGVYGTRNEDARYQHLFDRLESIPGVDCLGALNQAQLYEQYARASVFFYPCTWPETYCLAMDEAIAHGCVPVVSGLGALPERAFHANEGWFANPFNIPVRAKVNPRSWMDVAADWMEVLGE